MILTDIESYILNYIRVRDKCRVLRKVTLNSVRISDIKQELLVSYAVLAHFPLFILFYLLLVSAFKSLNSTLIPSDFFGAPT